MNPSRPASHRRIKHAPQSSGSVVTRSVLENTFGECLRGCRYARGRPRLNPERYTLANTEIRRLRELQGRRSRLPDSRSPRGHPGTQKKREEAIGTTARHVQKRTAAWAGASVHDASPSNVGRIVEHRSPRGEVAVGGSHSCAPSPGGKAGQVRSYGKLVPTYSCHSLSDRFRHTREHK